MAWSRFERHGRVERLAAWYRASRTRIAALSVALVVLLAAALRIHRIGDLSLWLDEGSTVYFARLPWDTVAGLNGGYDTHPPLYYVLTKASALVVPEVLAGRIVSAIGGTLAVLLVMLIALRVAGWRVAVVAGLVAATSPLLIWYSQEARQYGITSAAILLSYLALVAFWQAPRLAWAVTYGLAVLAAMYLDYSAFYALAPQLIPLILVARRHRQSALPLFAAGAVAVLAYLPWVPYVSSTVVDLGESRGSFLGLTPAALWDSILSVLGIDGRSYFASTQPAPLADPPSLQGWLGAGVLVLMALGAVALSRNLQALSVAVGLAVGTILVAVTTSLVSPGLAARTVSYAAFGCAMLAAAALIRPPGPRWGRTVTRVAAAGAIALPLLWLPSVYAGEKQHWRELADETLAVADAAGLPVWIHPTFAPTLIDVYQPRIHGHPLTTVHDDPEERRVAQRLRGESGLVLSHHPVPLTDELLEALAAAGFERTMHRTYFYNLALDIWLRPDAQLGEPLPLGLPDDESGEWTLPAGATIDQIDGTAVMRVPNRATADDTAIAVVPAAVGALYTLSFEARLDDAEGVLRAFLICADEDGNFLSIAPDPAGIGVPADGGWHRVRTTVLCGEGTSTLRMDFRNMGPGEMSVRRLELHGSVP